MQGNFSKTTDKAVNAPCLTGQGKLRFF